MKLWRPWRILDFKWPDNTLALIKMRFKDVIYIHDTMDPQVKVWRILEAFLPKYVQFQQGPSSGQAYMSRTDRDIACHLSPSRTVDRDAGWIQSLL